MSGYPILSLLQEVSAYEALWDGDPNASFRSLAAQLASCLASSLVLPETIEEYKKTLLPIFKALPAFGVRVEGDGMFPKQLKDARFAPKILYYQGDWELLYRPSIAIVGTRQPTQEGIERTRSLTKKLVADHFVIVSGLATGIDTAAHKAAIEAHGNTIAVIGTPLNQYYPRENKALQNIIAQNHLLISQVPFTKYARQDYRKNRFFFPERNITMSALSQATIIVEAGETSGTLIQAKAALEQGRKLIILENNFLNKELTWPEKFQEQGAIRAKNYDEIRQHLSFEES